jgi:hypothetical protein
MTTEYRYAGPGGEGIDALPAGVGAAIGSEYCVHLLPAAPEMARACAAARTRGIPLLLLTPYFRDPELKRAIPLFRAIPDGADAAVAVNDWGALLALRVLLPRLRLTIGRLLSGQKRCPRIESSLRLSAADRAWHRQGLFSSARARAFLAEEFGVSGYHVDAIAGIVPPGAAHAPAGPGPGDAPGAGPPPALFVHAPYAIVTVSDACPWLGGRSSSSVVRCPRPCREGTVVLREPSMGREMLQRGKARFVRTGEPPREAGARDPQPGIVLYDDIP